MFAWIGFVPPCGICAWTRLLWQVAKPSTARGFLLNAPKVAVAAVLTLAVLTITLIAVACTASEPTPVPTDAVAQDTVQPPTDTPVPAVATTAASPVPTATATPHPTATSTLVPPTSAPTPAPTATQVPPTSTLAPAPTATPIPPTDTPVPTPTVKKDPLVAQVTKIAPTHAAVVKIAPTLAASKGQHSQWTLFVVAPTEQQKARFGSAGNKSIRDGRGQQYTCYYYLDGREIPRVNLAFPKNLTYTVVTDQSGISQGLINATTTVDAVTIPLEWRTWTSRVDRIRLRGDDAARLVREMQERNTTEFELTLHDNQELSNTYDVSNLIDAMAINGMTCFIGQ